MDLVRDAISQQNTYLPTILVVEDDKDNRLLLKYALEMFNYKSLITAYARQAFVLAQTYQPDIILLDIILQHTNGLQLASLFKNCEATKHIPIIALTSLAKKQEIKLIFGSGCDDYLNKPYFLDDLQSTIQLQLDIAHKIKEAPIFCCLDENFNPI